MQRCDEHSKHAFAVGCVRDVLCVCVCVCWLPANAQPAQSLSSQLNKGANDDQVLHHEFTWSLCLLWSGVQKANSNPSPLVVRHAPDTQRPGFSSSRNPIFSSICSLRYLQLPAKKSKQNLVCYLCTAPEACTLGSIALSLVYDRLKYQYKLVKHVQNYCHAVKALLGVKGS